MAADVLLTHSYHLPYDRKQLRKMQPYPPLGTLYAANLLRQHGLSVALFDAMLEDPGPGFANALEQAQPRVVAIYEDNFNFLSKMCLSRMRQVAFDMVAAARSQGASVVVNGSDATDRTADYLNAGADYVLLGEAEWTLLELVQSLTGGGSPAEHIAGLAYSSDSRSLQRVMRTSPRGLMGNLEVLPLPAWDLVDMERYRAAWNEAHGFFCLNLTASRGCPYRCNWCAKPIYGSSYSARHPESVAAEMSILKETYGADYLWFTDDLFGPNTAWVEELAVEVSRRNTVLPFRMQSRADLMKERTVAALREAGCAEVWMGVESGSQKILDAMDKGIRIEQVRRARELLKAHGIRACYFLQFGYPGETWADIESTIDLVRSTAPDDIGVSVAYPLPGTVFYDRVREQLNAKLNWDDSEDLSMMFKGAYTSEFYRALHDALHADIETWSPASGWKFSLRDRADMPRLELWRQVEQLERTCRHADPTCLPVPVPASTNLT